METKDKGSELSGFVYTINRQLHVGIVKILQPGSKIGGPRLKDQGSRSDHSADYASCSSHVPFPRRHSPSASEAKTCMHMPPPWRGKRNSRSGNDNVGHLVPKPQPSLSVDSNVMKARTKASMDLPSPLFHSQSTIFEGAWQPPTRHENRWHMSRLPSPCSILYLHTHTLKGHNPTSTSSILGQRPRSTKRSATQIIFPIVQSPCS